MDPGSIGVGAVITAIIAGFFTWLTQRSKGKIDESAVLMAGYKELLAASERNAQQQIDALTKRLTTAEEAIANMKLQHAEELAKMKKTHADDVRARDDIIAGLQRMIAQNSRSQTYLMDNPDKAAVTKASRKDRGEE